MHLTQSTDLALRALMLMAVSTDRRSASELADRLRIPPQHMTKIVQRLRRHGLVETIRGRGGGVVLADGVLDMRVGAIVRDLEGPGEAVACECPPCPLRHECRLRGALRVAQKAFLASLDQVRVGDLITDPTGPILLSLSAPDPEFS